MSLKFTLVESGNTMGPALVVLHEKGYQVYVQSHTTHVPRWIAECEHRAFQAGTPSELLGLVSIWERFGTDWQGNDAEQDLADALYAEARRLGKIKDAYWSERQRLEEEDQ